LGVVLLLPALARPTIGLVLVAAGVAIWLAWKSVAYPLALAGIPTIVDAIVGYNPLPKGGVTFIFAAWIGVAVAFAMMRKTHELAVPSLMSAPVLLSLALLAIMLLRLAPSPAEAFGSTKLQLYIADNLAFLVAAVVVGTNRNDLRLTLSIMLIVASCGALLLAFRLLSGGIHTTLSSRFSLSAQEYPIQLGRSSADGVILAIYFVLTATRTWARMAAMAVLPLLIVALLAAGSRGPVIAFALGLVVLLGLIAASGRDRRRLLLVAAALFAAVIVAPLLLPGSSIGRALSALVGSGSGVSSNGRSELWAQAFAAFGAHPLLGLGTGGFASLSPTELYPHNLLLEMSAELGVVGVLLIGGVILGFAARLLAAWRTGRGTDKIAASALIALFLMMLVNAFFSGAIQDNSELWIWGGMGVGLSYRLAAQRRRDARAPMLDPLLTRAPTSGARQSWSRPYAA
jgi:O-antigen ligase